MDSIDKFGRISPYNAGKTVSAYTGINNLVNQLNRDNQNSFARQMNRSAKETISGEIINLKSNEITVMLDDGKTITAQIYDSSALSIGQRIEFHLQEEKGVMVLEPVKVENMNADTIVKKALEAAKLPLTARNINIAKELLNNNMSLDTNTLNDIISQANANKTVSPQNLILMNKHNIPVNNDNAMELDKYRNYEHRLVKEIDSISSDFPEFIDEVVNSKSLSGVREFNNKLISIIAKPSASVLEAKALLNINNHVSNTSEFTPFSAEKITIEENNILSQSKVINRITNNVNASLSSSDDINRIHSNINSDINKIIIENIGEVNNVDNGDRTIKFSTFDNNGPIDLSTLSPVGRDVDNPLVSTAFLKPSSADEILSILEPYNIDSELAKGIKDGSATLRDVAVAIQKAYEMADEIDEYRVSDYNYQSMGTSSVKYGGITSAGMLEMQYMEDNSMDPEYAQVSERGNQNTIQDVMARNNTPDYVNVLLAKDAFEHPVIKNILSSYEALQRDNSEISTFLSPFNRGQLTAILRDIPGSDELASTIWNGNISANELLVSINSLLDKADGDTVKKLLTSSEYKSVVSEAIINNWTISPNALKKDDAVSQTYERMYHELSELQALVRTSNIETEVAKQVSKEFGGMKNNVEFMNTLNNMFSYVQLPLKMSDKNIHSDLYVLTNKQNLKKNKGNISVLLHLDMDYLGTLDVNITLSSNVVTSRFYVTDDLTRELLDKNMEQLEYAMLEKGFILNSNVSLKEKDVNPINDFLEKDTPSTSIKRYTFDMRT